MAPSPPKGDHFISLVPPPTAPDRARPCARRRLRNVPRVPPMTRCSDHLPGSGKTRPRAPHCPCCILDRCCVRPGRSLPLRLRKTSPLLPPVLHPPLCFADCARLLFPAPLLVVSPLLLLALFFSRPTFASPAFLSALFPPADRFAPAMPPLQTVPSRPSVRRPAAVQPRRDVNANDPKRRVESNRSEAGARPAAPTGAQRLVLGNNVAIPAVARRVRIAFYVDGVAAQRRRDALPQGTHKEQSARREEEGRQNKPSLLVPRPHRNALRALGAHW